jgi:N-acetylglucosaminyl-diphospho-decaprenol L-rhamnosyltransferase
MSNRGVPQDADFHARRGVVDSHDPAVLSPRVRRRPRRARLAAWRRQFLDHGPIDVSVCIANWNCRDLLRGCLESLQDQPQGVRLEIILVDNASTDGAPDMVAREFPEVVLVRNAANVGFSRANNQAASKARGRYLFFLNNDTIVPPGTVRRLVEFAERHPEVGMVGPRLRDAQGHFQVSYRQQPTMAALLHKTNLLRWTGVFKGAYRRYRRQDFDANDVRRVDVLMGAAVLLPRPLFAAVGGWDEDFTFGGEDLDLSTRINQTATVVYLPQAEIVHFGRVSSRLHIGFASSQMAIGLVRYLRKTGYRQPAMVAYKAVVTLDAPLQLAGKVLQGAWRRLLRHKAEAHKSWLAARGSWHFLTRGLMTFWRA